MEVRDALGCLGATRVIWIDDHFDADATSLSRLLLQFVDVGKECGFSDIQPVLDQYAFDPENTEQLLAQQLIDLGVARQNEIQERLLQALKANQTYKTEMSVDTKDQVCTLLGIVGGDRWNFEKAATELHTLCMTGDDAITYIVDLNEAGGSATRGLEILNLLWQYKSKGTAFILTHDADVTTEHQREAELRRELLERTQNKFGPPLCVIAKERLVGDEQAIVNEAGLLVGIKRAGLLRSVHDVLASLHEVLNDSFQSAAADLLSIPPESLSDYVFERGFKEGVSELHVVERAITAHIARDFRTLFGTNDVSKKSVRRLRALRDIPLVSHGGDINECLLAFRQAEVWESPELINDALTPIACGDVFESNNVECQKSAWGRKFLLLAQPCDVSLRPDGQRNLESGFFVPLIKKPAQYKNDAKAPLLPFVLDDIEWFCDFRNATSVRLSILDLASFRRDGCVSFFNGQAMESDMLTGQSKTYAKATSFVVAALQTYCGRMQEERIHNESIADIKFQLTFKTNEVFNPFHTAAFKAKSTFRNANDERIVLPPRITWGLKRIGRVRMPYAAALLEQYVAVMSRRAFDLDFMASGVSHD